MSPTLELDARADPAGCRKNKVIIKISISLHNAVMNVEIKKKSSKERDIFGRCHKFNYFAPLLVDSDLHQKASNEGCGIYMGVKREIENRKSSLAGC